MQVNVVDVSSLNTHAAKNGRTYQSIEVMYKNNADSVQDVRISEDASTQAKQSAAPTRVTGSNYETKEERADRQVLIVRQSSLSNAVGTLAIAGGKATANDVISLAKLYEGYVLGGPSEQPSNSDIHELEEDLSFL